MNHLSEALLLFNRRILFICLSIIFAGISTGFFGALLISAPDKLYLYEFLQHGLTSANHTLPLTLITNLILMILFFLCGISLYGFPLVPALLFIRATALGFCIPLLFNTLRAGSFVITFIVPNLIFIFTFTAAAALALSYALDSLKPGTNLSGFQNSYNVTFIVLVAVISAASLIQSIV